MAPRRPEDARMGESARPANKELENESPGFSPTHNPRTTRNATRRKRNNYTMAYIQTTKNLLGDDLRSLIHSLTGFDSDSSEFAGLEDSAWHHVFNTYNTSVTDNHVKNRINGFVEKFLFHGFTQKAENLRTLINFYSDLDYFKKHDDKTIQWSIIHLLIRLSHKPTEALRDDPPLNIEDLVQTASAAPGLCFDWPTYLKQGWEKFRLPSDESSSDSEDHYEFEIDDLSPPQDEKELSVKIPPVPIFPQYRQYDSIEECERRLDEIEAELHRWVRSQYQKPWWMVPNYRENITSKHPIANYCQTLLKWKHKRGKIDSSVRIVGDRKLIQVLLYALSGTDGVSCLFDNNNGVFSVKQDISMSSLSPGMFRAFLTRMFGKCVSNVSSLNQFITAVSKKSLKDPFISQTLLSYARAIKVMRNRFWKETADIESVLKSRKGIITLRTIYDKLRPWLQKIEFLCYLHKKAVDSDFEQSEPWVCSLRLLSVLLHEMETVTDNCSKKILLDLFLNSISEYLKIIGRTIKGIKDPDLKNEFLIYKDSEENAIKVRQYQMVLNKYNIPSAKFWDSFVSSSLRAISSVHFITQLNKRSQFSTVDFQPDALLKDVLSALGDALSRVTDLNEVEEIETWIPPVCDPKAVPELLYLLPKGSEHEPEMEKTARIRRQLTSDTFEHLYQPQKYQGVLETETDKFMKTLANAEIDLFDVNREIREIFTAVVNKYREPEGFAYEVLIDNLRLLQHLRMIRRICFVQNIVSFVHTLFEKIMANQQSSCDWTYELRNCMLDFYNDEDVERFQCFLTQVAVSDANHPSYVHSSLNLARIVYQPDANLKIVIPDSCMKGYNKIFRLFLQVEWSWFVITKRFLFELRGVDETEENVVKFRKMFLLRMSLIHLMNCLRNYLFNIDEIGFENKIKQLCHEARDLQTIERAHQTFLLQCKSHCFLKQKTCSKQMEALLILCFKCYKLWSLRDRMTMQDVNDLMNEFVTTINRFTRSLHHYELRYSHRLGTHFFHLISELPSITQHIYETQDLFDPASRTTSY